jgi:hypothetical protein
MRTTASAQPAGIEHFYPFGGMVKTLEWVHGYNAKHGISA